MDKGQTSGYLVYHQPTKEFLALNVVNENNFKRAATQLKKEDPVFNLPFKKKVFLYSGQKTTIVPDEFYSESLKKNVFEINFATSPGETIESIFLEELKSYFLFSIPGDLLFDIGNTFEFDRVYHSGAAFLRLINSELVKTEGPQFMAVDIASDKIMVGVWKDSLLQIFSIFPYGSMEELLYMIVSISTEFGINPDSDRYFFTGDIYRNSELYKLLYKYLRHPVFPPLPEMFNFTGQFEQIPSHFYYAQTGTVLLCE